MPAPYSDNLYSGDDNPWAQDEQQHDDSISALSPADGYFHASSSGPEEAATSSSRQASSVPHVPNVMVEDPTLHEDRAAAKAREAAEESRINRAAAAGGSTAFEHHHQPHHQPGGASFYQPSHPFGAPQFEASSSSSSPASPSSGHHHRRSIDEEVSSFQPSGSMGRPADQYTVHRQTDAPPAYSPSASSPPLSSSYQTFTPPTAAAQSDAMGVPEENQALLPRQPESMGGPPNGSEETLWRRIKRNTATRKRVRTILGVLLIISIVAALFGGTISISNSNRKKPGIIDDSPVKAPPTNNNPPPNMVWPPSNNCQGGPYKDSKINEVVSFGTSKKLSIVQTFGNDGRSRRGPLPSVYGEVILQPVDTSSSGQIQLEVATNDQDLHVDVDFNKRDQQFKVTVPRWVDWREPSWRPCIQIRITVSVPREAQLESFHIDTIHLNVAVRDGFVLSSLTDAQIKTISGDVITGSLSSGDVAPYALASRSIIIDTVSGDVSGWFPLYDLLKIHTVSGTIKADLTPKPSQDKKPEQAVLSVESVSGNIKVVEPLLRNKRGDDFPPRDYVVGLSSSSGHVDAELAFTSKAKFESISGDVRLTLLPLFGSSSSSQPTLSTDTKSGKTTVTLLEPLWKEGASRIGHYDDPTDDKNSKLDNYDEPWIIIHPDQQPDNNKLSARSTVNTSGGGDGLVRLKSHHASISGDFKLAYPASWAGEFLMTTLSGGQDIRGDDLHYKRSGGIIKRIEGTKGDGASDLTVDSMSGREELVFGAR